MKKIVNKKFEKITFHLFQWALNSKFEFFSVCIRKASQEDISDDIHIHLFFSFAIRLELEKKKTEITIENSYIKNFKIGNKFPGNRQNEQTDRVYLFAQNENVNLLLCISDVGENLFKSKIKINTIY